MKIKVLLTIAALALLTACSKPQPAAVVVPAVAPVAAAVVAPVVAPTAVKIVAPTVVKPAVKKIAAKRAPGMSKTEKAAYAKAYANAALANKLLGEPRFRTHS